jgi:acetyl-CoA acetyltransferase
VGVRNPAKDKVAIVGAGRVPYARDAGCSGPALAIAAAQAAIRDAGITKEEVDGVCGSPILSDIEMQIALGLPEVTWGATLRIPFAHQLVEAINAVWAGACETAVVYHATYRAPGRVEEPDPIRQRAGGLGAYGPMAWKTWAKFPTPEPGVLAGGVGYAAWAARYLSDFGRTREDLGLVAINNRSHATKNKEAVMRTPLTLEDYLAARVIRAPLCLYDLDVPVDGADAFVVTSAERAADLCDRPVLVHAATLGRTARAREDQIPDLADTGQTVVARTLWEKSDLRIDDFDLFFGYDGYSIINLLWLESVGYCGPGEAGPYLKAHWDKAAGFARLNGRVLMNTHGGSLSEGGTQGAGIVQEAVRQLQGRAQERQIDGVHCALVTIGGFVWNAAGLSLRTET